jgi:hypothetical protein
LPHKQKPAAYFTIGIGSLKKEREKMKNTAAKEKTEQSVPQEAPKTSAKHKIVVFNKERNEDNGFTPKLAIDLQTIDSISQDRTTGRTMIKQKNGGKIVLADKYEDVIKVWSNWLEGLQF